MQRSAQLLRLLPRLGASSAEASSSATGMTLIRQLSSSNAIIGDSSSFMPSFDGKRQERNSFSAQMRLPSLSFASQLHTVTGEDDKSKSERGVQVTDAVPKIPSAMVALPARRASQSALAQQRAMATAAHADDHHHGPYWVAHPFHVLPTSPWPFYAGFGAGLSCLGMASFFHAIPGGTAVMLTGMLSTTATAIAWWRDIIIESDKGFHTEVVKQNLMSGVWLFIASEAMLFFGLLWSCIHLGMSPNVHVQMQWPPVGIEAVGWDKRALVMSAVLAGSYFSANIAMVAKDPKTVMGALGATLALGVLFLGDQYLEYSTAPFNITDGPYGTTFYITTGFHGMHVLLGAIWLATSMAMYPRYNNPGVGMRGGILYWHFVDIVWIAVYGIIYVAQL